MTRIPHNESELPPETHREMTTWALKTGPCKDPETHWIAHCTVCGVLCCESEDCEDCNCQ